MQITLGTFNEVREQLKRAYIIPSNISEKVYAEKLDREANNIYRTLRTYERYRKYPLIITVLDNRPKGRHCIYSI